MQLLKHFKDLTVRPKNAHELKGLILQLAIQGKLTAKWRANNPDIENAPILLKRIQKEKAQLVKEKIIKKEKSFPPITKEEILYYLPEAWAWSRLGDYSHYGALSKCENVDANKNTWVLELEDIEKESSKLLNKVRFPERDFKSTKSVFKAQNVIYGKLRPYLDKVLVADEDGVCTTEMIPIKTFCDCSPEYLRLYLKHPSFIEYANGSTHGMRMPRMGTDVAKKALISVPPIEEQKEIVRVVENLFKEVEQLEQLTVERISLKEDFVTSALNQFANNNAKKEWEFLQGHFQTFFNETSNIKKLRETVLQLAVQGKLTSDWRANNPDTEDASVLLKRIQKEIAQLIKEKKIKKEKLLPPITKDEIPYELPEGWVWCRFQEVFDIRDGTHDSPKNADGKDTFPLVTSKDFKNGEINFENAKRISKADYNKIILRSLVEEDDILFSMIGGNLGNQVMVKGNTDFAIKNVALFKYYNKSLSVPGFLKTFSEHIAYAVQEKASGGAQPFVSLTFLRQMLIPLPPLEEQNGIVQKINVLMGLCDALEQEIQHSQVYSEQLMQSCLREVFEGKGSN